jgi:hypothetical protein
VKRAALALAVVALAASACKDDPPKVADAAPSASAAPSALLSFTFADASPDPTPPPAPDAGDAFDPAAWANATPESAKSIGHTSVVFKLHLSGGLEAAFKPESKRGKKRWRGEVAAYRLGIRLGLANVPPAIAWGTSAPALETATRKDPAAAKLWQDEVIVHAGGVRGALIPWIPKLEFLPLESATWRARFTGWLAKGGTIPEDQVALAAQIATMLVFDFLTANWDRWSGGNVGLDRAQNRLLFIDNDGAFFEPAPPQPLAAQRALLKKTDKFSRAFVAKLRALDAVGLADAFGDDVPGEPLLAPNVVAAVEARRREVLAEIDAKIAANGEASVLPFP